MIERTLTEFISNLGQFFQEAKGDRSIVDLSHNRNSVISGNYINSPVIMSHSEQDLWDRYNREYVARRDGAFEELRVQESFIEDSGLEKQIRLTETLSKLRHLSLQHNSTPIIRMHSMTTGLANYRQPSDMSDIALLEREERSVLRELIQSSAYVRMILTLDLEAMFYAGITSDEAAERIGDLVRFMDSQAESRHLEFVIDDHLMLDSTWIIDTVLLLRQISFDKANNYYRSLWSGDPLEIRRAIVSFETRFAQLWQFQNPLGEARSPSEMVARVLDRRLRFLTMPEKGGAFQ
jgi:hypothetical protein